ncbi:hypothetical protein [Paractinoplanes ovalisporus]|nr:hypothetical protein [Actinoplanes ovalisporus]
MRSFGRRATFAVEVGGLPAFAVEAGATRATNLREVDVWAGGRRLTCHDNTAFVPTLVHHMRSTAELIQQRAIPPSPFPWRSPAEVFRLLNANDSEFRQRFWLLHDWDEILDNVETYAWLDDQLVIACRIQRPIRSEVFVARLDPDECVTTINEAVDFLAD